MKNANTKGGYLEGKTYYIVNYYSSVSDIPKGIPLKNKSFDTKEVANTFLKSIENKGGKGFITDFKKPTQDEISKLDRDRNENYMMAKGGEVNCPNCQTKFFAKGGNLKEEEVQYGSWDVEISEDENDEELRNQEVARLIRGGYMSGFNPTWSLEITDIDGDIDESTEEEIARLVEQGYTGGEVVMYKYAKGGRSKSRDDMFLSQQKHEQDYSKKKKKKVSYKKRK